MTNESNPPGEVPCSAQVRPLAGAKGKTMTTGAYSFTHDREHEDLHKMPRKGMWNWHSGKLNIRCPDCGNVSFVDNHENVGDYLNPSVVCPHAGCGFHTQPTELQGYRYASNVDGE